MHRFWLAILFFVLFLAACSKPLLLPTADIKAIFSDEDLDNATLSLSPYFEEVKGTVNKEITGITQGQVLPKNDADVNHKFEAQAILPNTNGYVYYFRYEPEQNLWIVERSNQTADSYGYIYTGQREIQAVGGSLDGISVILSMRETTSPTSDFEIYRLNIFNNTAERLTNNNVDDTNVSLSADGKTIAWQTLASGNPSVVFRRYSSFTTFTQRRLAYPIPAREPSISSNGRFISYIHDRSNGLDQLWKYDDTSNSYTAIYSTPDTSAALRSPSITDDGNKIMFLMVYPSNQDIQYIDLTTNQRRSAVYSTRSLEHPFITADGKYLTYGYSGQLPSTNPRDFTVYVQEIASGQLAGIRYAATGVSQGGMSWQKAPSPFGNQQRITPTDIPSGVREPSFGWSIDVDSNTAVVGAFGDSYDADGNGIIDCEPVFFEGHECRIGSVYILERNSNGQWTILKKLPFPNAPRAYTEFGRAVAISNNTIAAYYASSSIGANPGTPGVLLYERNLGGINNWGLSKTLTPSSAEYGIALEGNTLVTDNGIYERNLDGTNSWGLLKSFTSFVEARVLEGDVLVTSNASQAVDINKDGVIDCPNGTSGTECFVGQVYVYKRNLGGTNNWGLFQTLTASNPLREDYFGRFVAIDGNTLVISNDAQRINKDIVYIFTLNPNTNLWAQTQRINASGQTSPSDVFVSGLSIDNGTLAISKNPNTLTPYIDIYTQNFTNPNSWILLQTIIPSNVYAFSGQIVVNQNIFAAGSYGDGLNGAAYFYSR